MQDILLQEPYHFVPPHNGNLWVRVFYLILPWYLKKTWGLVRVDCRGLEHLKESLAVGRGVLLAPNHSRPCDPMLLGMLARAAKCHLFIMASAHLFYQGKFQRWLLPRLGAFSIYREGLDRAALDMAMTILEEGRRPLLLFAEGVVSRNNDRLGGLMEGLNTIVRGATKRRISSGKKTGIAVHPVAIRYFYHGNLRTAVEPVLSEIESRLTWLSTQNLPVEERLGKIGCALLCLKELEYFGATANGTILDRIENLVNAVLSPLEIEWFKVPQSGTVVSRVKKLRSVILPEVIKGELGNSEQERRWRQLKMLYVAQQMSFYPADYVTADSPPEHILETVERFEEDLTDTARIYSPMTAVIEVAPAMVVGEGDSEGDTAEHVKRVDIMPHIEGNLTRLIEALKAARPK